MSIRKFMMIGAMAGLAACQPAIPDSGAAVVDTGRGVGFDDPSTLSARQARDAQLTTSIVPNAPVVSGEPLSAIDTPVTQPTQRTARAVSDPQSLDAELAAGANAARVNSGQPVLNASPSNAAPLLQNNPTISDENSFEAVAGRETIASDAARVQSNSQQYQVVQPTALPKRVGNAQPNVVEYALQTKHAKGTKVYRRLNIGSVSSQMRNCSRYASADEAQIDFLARGGPTRDRRGLDPDGDGYACAWDPAPFRSTSGG